MKILGISAFYHDSAAAIIIDGEIRAAAQQERFSRIKHDPSFPSDAVKYCLNEFALDIDDLDAVAFYDKPLLKFERLLETYYSYAPKGLKSFRMAMPVWLKEKMFLKRLIRHELAEISPFDQKKMKLLFPEHHLSHAASAFYPSPFREAAILTIDGVGEWATATICHGKGKTITILKELRFPHSVGLLYSAFTYYLGFRVNSGEYKLMGLAPYGNPGSENVLEYEKLIRNHLVKIYEDGSIWLNQNYFDYSTGLRMSNDKKWEELFGFERRRSETEINQKHCDLALAIQKVTEEVISKMADEAKKLTGSLNLCLAGGVALNCVANGKLVSQGIFNDLFIQPAAGDAGGAPGAALAAYHIFFDQSREITNKSDAMNGAYLSPDFTEKEIRHTILRYNAKAHTFSGNAQRSETTAEWLAEGNVVGWMQGQMEFGPRALGNRSILGDVRNSDMQKKLNLKIKYRESFRPFAPSVIAEKKTYWFDLNCNSPYMLLVAPVSEKVRFELPVDYDSKELKDKLYTVRSSLPAITHVDYSARIQTVHKETNPVFYDLIMAFERVTGVPVIVNTSFNVRGEPIVCTPEDAYRCFMRTDMDYLVIGNTWFSKKEQPEWPEGKEWQNDFKLD